MVASLQRKIVFALLLAVACSLGIAAAAGHAAVGLICAGAIVAGSAAVLAVEFICLYAVEPSVTRPSATDLVRAWGQEAFWSALVFAWWQPFRSTALPDVLPLESGGPRGLVLVHGLLCNRGFWNPWLLRLRRHPHPVLAVSLEPPFASIDAYVDAIDRAVARMHAATGIPPVIVAHSMGGLVVRKWLCRTRVPARVHRLITVGTPHRGTWLARFARSQNGTQMAIGSSWLHDLERAETAGERRTLYSCFYGNCDNVVFPSAHAQLEGSDNILLQRSAHVALAYREEVFAEALRWLGHATLDRQ